MSHRPPSTLSSDTVTTTADADKTRPQVMWPVELMLLNSTPEVDDQLITEYVNNI